MAVGRQFLTVDGDEGAGVRLLSQLTWRPVTEFGGSVLSASACASKWSRAQFVILGRNTAIIIGERFYPNLIIY